MLIILTYRPSLSVQLSALILLTISASTCSRDMAQTRLLTDEPVNQQLTYHRTFGQPAMLNGITKLPREVQHMIFGFLIGDAQGKFCCKQAFGPNVPEGIACFQEADTLLASTRHKKTHML